MSSISINENENENYNRYEINSWEDENLDLSEVLGKSKSKDVTDPTSEIEKSISNILKKK